MTKQKLIERDESASLPIASQLNQMVRAGLPLESGLRALAEQTRSSRMRRALFELSDNLERGTPIAEALGSVKAGLPRSMRALVEAGMESGRLDCLMQYSVEQTQRLISLRQQVWLFLSYPLFLVWMSASVCGASLLLIPSSFKGIFNDFGMAIPGVTEVFINISSAMNTVGWPVWLLISVVLGVMLLSVQVFGISNSGRRYSTSIPIIGRVFQYAALADLCRLLAMLAESDLPLPRALRFAGAASEDRWLSLRCQIVADDIENGTAPSAAAALARLPNSLAQVFRSVSSKQIFIEALRGLAEIYAARCFNSSQLVNCVVAPIAVTLIVGFVSIMLISMFLPLFILLSQLA